MANSESNNKLLLREDTIPREAPYYCFEFIIYNTKQSFQLFYEQNFPKLSRLFALGLGRFAFLGLSHYSPHPPPPPQLSGQITYSPPPPPPPQLW